VYTEEREERAGVEADAHPKVDAVVLRQLVPVVRHGFLDGQGGMAGPLGVILMGQGGAEEGHHPVSGELVDGPLIAMDLLHEDLEAPIQDLVDLLRVQLLGEGGVMGHVGEEDGDLLSLRLNRWFRPFSLYLSCQGRSTFTTELAA